MRIPGLEVWGSIAAILVCVLLFFYKPLTPVSFAALLLNLEGTIFLASSISFQIPPIGNSFLERLKWVVVEFPKYKSPASFNPVRFYLGILFLVLGALVGVACA